MGSSVLMLMSLSRGVAEAAGGASGAEEEAGERISASERYERQKVSVISELRVSWKKN